jgi:hypothetical protein
MCACGGTRTEYVVTYPDGRTEVKTTPSAARIAASQVAGATWEKRTAAKAGA